MLTLLLTLAWETAARSSELLQLEWSDVDLERRLSTFPHDPSVGGQTQGRRSRTVPLSDEARRAFRHHAASFRLLPPPSPYRFEHLHPNRSVKPGDRLASLYLSFKDPARPIGLSTLPPHPLRHSFVTRELAAGVAAQLVMRAVGHAEPATTLRYTHLMPEQLKGVVADTRDGSDIPPQRASRTRQYSRGHAG
jgi:integrase